MPTSTTIALVACVKSKQAVSTEARYLYSSALFRGCAAYAEAMADRWFILSARYGLLSPDVTVAPYEQTLLKMSGSERRQWAQSVARSIQQNVNSPAHIIMLAGTMYREQLSPLLEHAGFSIEVPMARLRLGEQLRWLKEMAKHGHQ